MATKQKVKPCPNLPKGQVCPLCGGQYVCLDWKTRKGSAEPKTNNAGTR